MVRCSRRTPASLAIAGIVITSGVLLAQGALGQLGLTEATARTFLFDEIKSPARDRRSAIAITGNRAFLKLPPSARGPAATALFAWAKVYVNSPAFKTLYANYLKDMGVPPKRLTVDEEVQKTLDDMLAGVEQAKRVAALLPPADRAGALDQIKQGEAIARDPETFKKLKASMEAARGQPSGNDTPAKDPEEALPADSQKLFARRLREFLKATADATFSAKTISLTGGADGIEFIDPVDRKRSWVWQAAVIAGQEATTAARAAAESWLKEIEK